MSRTTRGWRRPTRNGLVKILDVPGNVAVMVRLSGMVSVYSVLDTAGVAGRGDARREELHLTSSSLPT